MVQDLKDGMDVNQYMKKYNCSKDTYYNHRKSVLKPEEIKAFSNYNSLDKVISEEKRQDLLNGMNLQDYMKKYNCNRKTYYIHRKFVIPNDEKRLAHKNECNRDFQTGLSEEQKQDLLNGISEREYCIKYNTTHTTYQKYKKLVAGGYEANTLKTHRLSDKQENKKPHIDPIVPKLQKVKICTENIDDEFVRKFVLYYKNNPDFMKCANRFCKSVEYISFLYNKCVENGYIIIHTETNKETSVSASSQNISDEPTSLNPALSRPTPKFVQNTLF